MTFDEVMKLTRTVSSPTAYEDDECRLLYDTLCALPDGAVVVEVGCEYGRSTSIILQVAREKRFDVTLIDPFLDPESAPALARLLRLIGHPVTLMMMTSEQAGELYEAPVVRSLDFLHIDGDHSAPGVVTDIEEWVFGSGVLVAFHDYGRDTLPDVKAVVDDYAGVWNWTRTAQTGTLVVYRT